jgi:hypothetical protein
MRPRLPRHRLLSRAAAAALIGFAAALGAGGLAALAEPSKAGFAPDPPPHASRTQWTFDVAVAGGKVSVERGRSVTLDQPAESPRVVGRFALELYVGPTLLERVRFNVPLLGDGPAERSRRNVFHGPATDQVTTKLTVRMADHPRAAYLVLVDRATGETRRFDWPPAADGKLTPWVSGLSDAGPGDFPKGGARVMGKSADAGDGGKPASPAPVDAGHD